MKYCESESLTRFTTVRLFLVAVLVSAVLGHEITMAEGTISPEEVLRQVLATVDRWQPSVATATVLDDFGEPTGELSRSWMVSVQRSDESFAFKLRGVQNMGLAMPATELRHRDPLALTLYEWDRSLRQESPPPRVLPAFPPHEQALQGLGFVGTLAEFLDPQHDQVMGVQVTFRQLPGESAEEAGRIEIVRKESLPESLLSRRIRLEIVNDSDAMIVAGQAETVADSIVTTTHRVVGKVPNADEHSLRYECLCEVLATTGEPPRQTMVTVCLQRIAEVGPNYRRALDSFPGNPKVTVVRDGQTIRQGPLRSKVMFGESASPLETWLIVNDILLAAVVLWIMVRIYVVPSKATRAASLVWLALGCGLLAGCRDATNEPLAIVLREPVPQSVLQNSTFEVSFDIVGFAGNPYDPAQVDAAIEIQSEGGQVLRQPAYFTEPHDVLMDHDQEVVRTQGSGHWIARWTSAECGHQHWTLVARSAGGATTASGELEVVPSAIAGRIQVSKDDPRYFAFADGQPFYLLGHGTRSPLENRWATFSEIDTELVAAIQRHRTFNYDAWFAKLHAQGANFCVVWMAPWWLGLQWSETRPGYAGLGEYNQIHAAQLDRIFELAERYKIKILLYTANHGQLSSVIDREWHLNPYNATIPGGIAEHPLDFFRSPQCRESYKNYLRYVVARYGHSSALFAIGLCTETNWVEPYDGRRCDKPESDYYGTSEPNYQVPRQPWVVDDWLVEMARFIKSIDAHQHLVTTQFALVGLGNGVWENEAFDFVTSNCYQGEMWTSQIQRELRARSRGVAEGLFGWSKYHAGITTKPILVAEWGGEFLGNSAKRLAAEFHVGSWSLSMTQTAGVTGFWWWNEVERANLYPVYGAIQRFWLGESRTLAEFQSVQWDVMIDNPWRNAGFAAGRDELPSTTHAGVGLVAERRCYGYVYHLLASVGEFEVDPEGDERIVECDDLSIVIPPSLEPGHYQLQFWNCRRGTIVEERTIELSADLDDRRLKLPPIGVDLAFKLIAVEPR